MAFGVAKGLALSLGISRWVTVQLYGLDARDPETLAAASKGIRGTARHQDHAR